MLQAILISKRGRIYTHNYEEFVTIRNNCLTIARRMIDYAGSTAGITYMPIDLNSFIYYLADHREKLGEEKDTDNFTL